MKRINLILYILIGIASCETLETNLPEDPHRYIIESISEETDLYWNANTALIGHANILYNKNCNNTTWSNSDRNTLEELRQEAYSCLLVVIDKLVSLEGLVDGEILALYIEHYENDKIFILNLFYE
jgi:hypothetical protein